MSYPKRPQLFANRFVRLMLKDVAAQEVGPEGLALLTAIVMTEDAKRYRGPVRFFNQPLMGVCGFTSEKVFFRVRQKCVDAGWLVWIPGKKGVPARYWVSIPEQSEGIQDGPVDEFAQSESEGAGAIAEQSGTNREVIGNQLGTNRESIGGTFIPNPSPVPSPVPEKAAKPRSPFVAADAELPEALDTPEFRTAWCEWCACRASKRKPITAAACAKQLEELAGVGVTNAIAAISKSIANDWQGLFPERVVVNPRAGPNGKSSSGNQAVADKLKERINAAKSRMEAGPPGGVPRLPMPVDE